MQHFYLFNGVFFYVCLLCFIQNLPYYLNLQEVASDYSNLILVRQRSITPTQLYSFSPFQSPFQSIVIYYTYKCYRLNNTFLKYYFVQFCTFKDAERRNKYKYIFRTFVIFILLFFISCSLHLSCVYYLESFSQMNRNFSAFILANILHVFILQAQYVTYILFCTIAFLITQE